MKKMKYLYVILFSALFAIGVSTVKAEEYIDLSKVVEKFNGFDVKVDFEDCDVEDGKVTAKYNSDTEKSITFTCKSNGQALITLKEEDNDHTLNFTETEYTDEKLEEAFLGDEEKDLEFVLKHNAYTTAKYDIMDNFFEAFLNESGYYDMDLPCSFEEEDYLLEASVYTVGEPNALNIRYGKVFFEPINVNSLKLSFDKEKIKTFVEKVGDKYIRKLMDITPSLTLNNVTSNSANLNVNIDAEVDEEYQAGCYLFRSDTPNFDVDFRLGDNNFINIYVDNCLGDVVITDNDLTPNTTYYYRISLIGSTKLSDPIAVTTASAEPVTPTPEKPNPNTGAFVPGALLGLLAIGGIGALVYTNRKNKFKNY